MRGKIIIFAKKFIFGLHLGIIWKLLDYVKFEIEKKSLQLRAIFKEGDDQLKKELTLFYKGEKAYQPFINSNLQDIPFSREGEPRFKIIKENLSVSRGTLLDIGANLGYFCHKFEDEGFDCYALEENRMLCYFMEKLKKACPSTGGAEKKFKVIPQSIFDYKKNQKITFDVVLALSIFHHFLRSKDTYLNLIKLLNRLDAKELFFEPHQPGYFQTKKVYRDYTPSQFVSFIIENSCFKKAKLLGKSEGGRLIYKLTKKEK